jgi:tetratricopeptide (TPR) repeat protein
MKRASLSYVALTMLALCLSTAALGQIVVPKDRIALLPKFCQDRLLYGELHSPETQRYWDALGHGWTYLHHYCYGLYEISEASRFGTAPQLRKHLFNDAIGQIDFVLDRTDEKFPLRYAMLLDQAYAWSRLYKWPKAEEVLRSAIAINPEEDVGYFRLAEAQIAAGKRDDARETIETGLRHKPDSRWLKRALAKLSMSSKNEMRRGDSGSERSPGK